MDWFMVTALGWVGLFFTLVYCCNTWPEPEPGLDVSRRARANARRVDPARRCVCGAGSDRDEAVTPGGSS